MIGMLEVTSLNQEIKFLCCYLCTSTSKLLAQWQGPYDTVKPIGEVDCLINMHDIWNNRKGFYVCSYAKQFQSPTAVNSSFLVDDTVEANVARDSAPHAHRKMVELELQEMLGSSIIEEPSASL